MADNFQLDVNVWVPDGTNHPNIAVAQDRIFYDFDDSTDEILVSSPFVWPEAYTGSGTLKATISYIMTSATSGDVIWTVAVEAVTAADAVDLDSASDFDTANSVTDTVPGTQGYLAQATVTLTNADSVASGDMVRIKLTRDADNGSDTATGDARLLGVKIFEEA